ncbi:MAG: hypothetical protein ACLFTT_05035 [Candidatus Hydrogenedentota bacterium]
MLRAVYMRRHVYAAMSLPLRPLSMRVLNIIAIACLAAGCAQQVTQQPPPASPEVMPATAPAPPAVAPAPASSEAPAATLAHLREAVAGEDLAGVTAAFAPGFRPTIAQWVQTLGAAEVLDLLGAGLRRMPAHGGYRVVSHQVTGGARLEATYPDWPAARKAVDRAKTDARQERISVLYGGAEFVPLDGAWYLKRW